ncbi:MAG: dTMP kinase [Patescibacteria group bacterium]
MKKRGLFIVSEGTDGSGKTVQLERLFKRLKKKGFKCQTITFPQYGQSSAYFIEQYLTGKYGGWREVGPYRASLFYALDRYQAAQKIKKALSQGKIVLANRYFASNLGHQGAKINNYQKRKEFFKWIYNLEYNILGIPKPDLNLFLHVPAKISYQLVAKKGKREYLRGKKRDIHEKDIKHLKRAEQSYLQAIKLFPKDFKIIECVSNDKLLSIDEIAQKVWDIIKGKLFISN